MPYNRTCSCPAGYSEGLRNENAPDMGYACIEELDTSYVRLCSCDEGYTLFGDTCYADADPNGNSATPTYQRKCENKILEGAETIESVARNAVAQAMPYLDEAKKAFWKVYRFSEKILSTTKYSCSQKCQEAVLTMWDEVMGGANTATEWLVDNALNSATTLVDDLVSVADTFEDATGSLSDALGSMGRIELLQTLNPQAKFPFTVSEYTSTLEAMKKTLNGVEKAFKEQSETMVGWQEQISLAADQLAFPALTGVNMTVDVEKGIGIQLYFGKTNFGFTLDWGRRRRDAEKLFPMNAEPWDRKRRAATCEDAAQEVTEHALSAMAPMYIEIKDGVLSAIAAIEEEFNKKKLWVEYIKKAFTDGVLTTRSCECKYRKALYMAGTCTSVNVESHDHQFDNGNKPRDGFACAHAACVNQKPVAYRPWGCTKCKCEKRIFGRRIGPYECKWGFGKCRSGYTETGPVCTAKELAYTRKVDCNYDDYSGFADVLTTCTKASVDFTCDTECSGGKSDNPKWICGTGDNCDPVEEHCILDPNSAFDDEPDPD